MENQVGERIKQLRTAKKLTQQEFADRIGINRSNVANYEKGVRTPVDAVVSLICREFHIREEWLRSGQEPMEAPVDEDQELADFFAQVYQAEPDDPCRRVIAVMQKINKNHPELFQAVFDAVAETHKKQED